MFWILISPLLLFLLCGFILFIFEKPTKQPEMYKGKPRYIHIRECGPHFIDDEYYDRKLKINVIK